MSIIVNTFRDATERARAIGIWSGVVGFSMALGPIVGGTLVDAAGWRSIFWINVPLGLAALALTRKYVPESRAQHVRAIDPGGQALVIVALGTLIYAIIEAPAHGWLSPVTILLLCASALAGLGLLLAERRARNPLIDLRFFRSAPFSAATVTAIAAYVALGAFLFVNTLYLQNVRGFSAMTAGLLTLPMAVVAAASAPVSGRILGARGHRIPLVASGFATAAGAAMLVGLTPRTPIPWLLVAYAVIGVGVGLVNAPITSAATSGMPRARAGVAAAIASTCRQIGTSLGVAISGCLLVGTSGVRFTTASHAAWALMLGCGLAVLALGVLATGRWAATTVERTSHLLDREGIDRDLVLS
jgi:EmrB/QacA subfamily drug resistance transporter